MRDSQVTAVDGRAIAYTDIGEAEWPCVFFFHGAPVSRLYPAYLEEHFRANRIRVVSPDVLGMVNHHRNVVDQGAGPLFRELLPHNLHFLWAAATLEGRRAAAVDARAAWPPRCRITVPERSPGRPTFQ